MIRGLLSISFLLCLVIQASSQGYLGTVSTGTGIESPITVGSGAAPQAASVGAAATQANLTGTMSLNLLDGFVRQLNLDIFQSGDLLLGYGNMTTATGSQRVTAAGSLTTNGMTLYVSAVDVPEVYRLEITGSGASLAGRYQAFIANGATWSGTVTGVSDQILSYRPMTTLGGGTDAGSLGTTIGQPAGTSGTTVGQSVGTLAQPIGSNTLTRNRSFYSSSNGQTIDSDGASTITTSGGTTTTTTTDGTTSVSYG